MPRGWRADNPPVTSDGPNKPLHVVLLNQPFFPDVVSTAQIAKDLADALVRRGHKVTAVASRSVYGQAGAALPRREEVPVRHADGGLAGHISVRRVGLSVFGKKGIAARLADFLFFYLLATLRVLTLPRPDIVVGFTTPPFIACVGVLARWLRGSKSVYWVMDLYPDVAIECGVMKPGSLTARFFERLSRWLLKKSSAVVVLGRCMRERVLAKGIAPDKVAWIPVWADLSGISPVAHEANPYRAKFAPGGEFVVMYSGNLGIGHDAQTMIDAMKLLKDDATIRFVFVGGGKRRREVEEAAAREKLTNFAWFEYQPREALGQSLSAADVHLISLRRGLEGIMVPSKLFGVMAAGRASIYIGEPSSEIWRVLGEAGAGVMTKEGDGPALARTIVELRDELARRRAMGEAARLGIEGKFDAATSCRAWITLLERLGRGAPIEPDGLGRITPAGANPGEKGSSDRRQASSQTQVSSGNTPGHGENTLARTRA
ncbi:MAG: glycosyltransferase [Tepidisphaera sp.]|nr:glycosyltransferase [Tepidisphaera sp.]